MADARTQARDPEPDLSDVDSSAAVTHGGRQHRDLVVVGASAGGVDALQDFAAGLPPNLAAAVVVVLHLPPSASSSLAEILTRAGPLPAVRARHGQQLSPGHLYTAPPDHHLLIEDGCARLSLGPAENGHRPSIDTTFRSASRARGPGVIGVVLSGALDDGAAGLAVITARGGAALVQDLDDARYAAMPESALESVPEALLLPARDMGAEIAALLGESPGPPDTPPPGADAAAREDGSYGNQTEAVERSMWAGVRALEEKRDLAGRMVDDAEQRGYSDVVGRYRSRQQESTDAAEVLRHYLLDGAGGSAAEPSGEAV